MAAASYVRSPRCLSHQGREALPTLTVERLMLVDDNRLLQKLVALSSAPAACPIPGTEV
jgi:hypothetical protein